MESRCMDLQKRSSRQPEKLDTGRSNCAPQKKTDREEVKRNLYERKGFAAHQPKAKPPRLFSSTATPENRFLKFPTTMRFLRTVRNQNPLVLSLQDVLNLDN